jgi:DNA primase
VILPDGHDPDEFVRRNGREKMEEVVAQAWPMADYYIDQILGGRGTLEEDRDKLREAVSFLSRLEDGVERNLFIKKVAEALVVDEEVLKKEVLRTLSHSPSAVPADRPRRTTAAEMDPLELSLIQMMLEYPEKAATVREADVLAGFRTEELKALGEKLLAIDREGRMVQDVSSLVGTLTEEGPLRERLLARLVQESPYTDELIDRQMADTIRTMRQRANKERGMILKRKIREAERSGNGELVDRLMLDMKRLIEEKVSLS